MNLVISIVVMMLVVGILIWAVKELPWIDENVKRLILIVGILAMTFWVLHKVFPAFLSW